MRLLLDTHAFLWFIQGNESLSKPAIALIEDPANQKLISIASLWEIAIKVSIGKLEIGISISELEETQILGNMLNVLNITPKHLNELAKLPFHHKDPFDRLIISQDVSEKIPIISRDKVFSSYSAQLLW